jgi:hypothetical protein
MASWTTGAAIRKSTARQEARAAVIRQFPETMRRLSPGQEIELLLSGTPYPSRSFLALDRGHNNVALGWCEDWIVALLRHQTVTNAVPIRISAAVNPTQIPVAPQRSGKHNT